MPGRPRRRLKLVRALAKQAATLSAEIAAVVPKRTIGAAPSTDPWSRDCEELVETMFDVEYILALMERSLAERLGVESMWPSEDGELVDPIAVSPIPRDIPAARE